MHVWRYDLGSWIEDDVPLAADREFPQGFERSPFMTLGDVAPRARGVSAAVHEATEGGRLPGHSLWGRRSIRPGASAGLPGPGGLASETRPRNRRLLEEEVSTGSCGHRALSRRRERQEEIGRASRRE